MEMTFTTQTCNRFVKLQQTYILQFFAIHNSSFLLNDFHFPRSHFTKIENFFVDGNEWRTSPVVMLLKKNMIDWTGGCKKFTTGKESFMKMVRLSYRFLPHKVHSHCKLTASLREDLVLNFWFHCCLGDMTLETSVLVFRIIAELVAFGCNSTATSVSCWFVSGQTFM